MGADFAYYAGQYTQLFDLNNMAELDFRKNPWNDGLSVPHHALSIEIYRLLCLVQTSSLLEKNSSRFHIELRQEHQEGEIGRLLIFIAAAIRNAMDQNPSRAAHWLESEPSDVVGVLIPNLKEPEVREDLHVRDGCHKIIHCDTINFDYRSRKPKRGDALRPKVHLYGSYRRKEWKATLEINRFVDLAHVVNV